MATTTLAIIAGDRAFRRHDRRPTAVRMVASLMRVDHGPSDSVVVDTYNEGIDAALGLIARGTSNCKRREAPQETAGAPRAAQGGDLAR